MAYNSYAYFSEFWELARFIRTVSHDGFSLRFQMALEAAEAGKLFRFRVAQMAGIARVWAGIGLSSGTFST